MTLIDAGPRETSHEAGGYVKGVAIAIVTNNKDDESNLCRVKVCYRWHELPQESYWARLAVPMAGSSRGVVMIPEVGDEVLVAFEREDLRHPYILGALWNGKDRPPQFNEDGKNDKRIITSRKGHHLLFDDGASGMVEVRHEQGRRIVLDDSGFTVEDGQGNLVQVDSQSGSMKLTAKGELKIEAGTVSIQSRASMSLKASASFVIQGATVDIN